jgi:hypothetical protein
MEDSPVQRRSGVATAITTTKHAEVSPVEEFERSCTTGVGSRVPQHEEVQTECHNFEWWESDNPTAHITNDALGLQAILVQQMNPPEDIHGVVMTLQE